MSWQLGDYGASWQSGAGRGSSPANWPNPAAGGAASPGLLASRNQTSHAIRLIHAESESHSVQPSLPSLPFSPALTADQTRCQAATAAILGQLIEIERGLAAELQQGSHCLPPHLIALQQELLLCRGADRGNEAATAALEVFFQLAEAQRQQSVLEQSLTEIESMQADVNELKSHDLPVDQDPGELERQHLANRERQRALRGAMAQGWAKLRVLLDVAGDETSLPRMEVGTERPTSPPDRNEACRIALERRPELRTLRLLIHQLTPTTLPLARAVLQQYEGSLGTAQAVGLHLKVQQLFGGLFFGPDRCPLPVQRREVEVRLIQLAELLDQRERAVTAEVEAALIAWQTALDQWAFADQKAASWRAQLDRLTQKRPVDEEITAFDLAQARLGLLQAESDRIKLSFEWRAAQVKLWTAQGTIAAGCGLPDHEPYWCDRCQSTHGLIEWDAAPQRLPLGSPEESLPPAVPPAPAVVPAAANLIPASKTRAEPVPPAPRQVGPMKSCRPLSMSK